MLGKGRLSLAKQSCEYAKSTNFLVSTATLFIVSFLAYSHGVLFSPGPDLVLLLPHSLPLLLLEIYIYFSSYKIEDSTALQAEIDKKFHFQSHAKNPTYVTIL